MNKLGKSWLAMAGTAAAGAATALTPGAAHAQSAPATVTPAADPDGEFRIMGTCGNKFEPEVFAAGNLAGKAYWEVVCRWSGSEWFVYLEGWVDDTWANGKCVWVRGERWAGDPNTQWAKNCPASSPRTNFTFKFPGRNANGYAYQES